MIELSGAISHALVILKGIKAIDARLREAELRSAIADLSLALADIKEKTALLQEENVQLRKLVDALRDREGVIGSVEFFKGAYWRREASRLAGPFCTRCFESEHKLMSLVANTAPFDIFGTHECPNCKSNLTVG